MTTKKQKQEQEKQEQEKQMHSDMEFINDLIEAYKKNPGEYTARAFQIEMEHFWDNNQDTFFNGVKEATEAQKDNQKDEAQPAKLAAEDGANKGKMVSMSGASINSDQIKQKKNTINQNKGNIRWTVAANDITEIMIDDLFKTSVQTKDPKSYAGLISHLQGLVYRHEQRQNNEILANFRNAVQEAKEQKKPLERGEVRQPTVDGCEEAAKGTAKDSVQNKILSQAKALSAPTTPRATQKQRVSMNDLAATNKRPQTARTPRAKQTTMENTGKSRG